MSKVSNFVIDVKNNIIVDESNIISLDWKLAIPKLTFHNIHNMVYGVVGNCCNIEDYDV